jgi:hypothetical protein
MLVGSCLGERWQPWTGPGQWKLEGHFPDSPASKEPCNATGSITLVGTNLELEWLQPKRKKKIQITTKHRDRQERKVQRRQGQMQAKEPGLRFACIGCNPTLVPPSLPLPRPMHPHHIRKSRDWLAAGFAPLPDGIPGRAFLCPGGAAEALQESLPFGTNR